MFGNHLTISPLICLCIYSKCSIKYVVVVLLISHIQLFASPWTIAHQAPLFMGFPRQEYWSELPFPSPWDLPDPEIKPTCPALDGRFFTTEPPGKPNKSWWAVIYKMRWKRGIQHFLDKHTWAQKLTNINYSQCCLGVISSAWNLGNCLHSP